MSTESSMAQQTQDPGQDHADVLAGLGVPEPSELFGKRLPGELRANRAEAATERLRWVAHAVLTIAFWCVSGVLCGVMAYWYFLHGFDWSTACCGLMSENGQLGKPMFDWALLHRLSGIRMWQIGAVVLATAALLKILIDRVKPR